MKSAMQEDMQHRRGFELSNGPGALRGKLEELVLAVGSKSLSRLSVLEIGCGEGNTLSEVVSRVSDRISDVRGVGVDENPMGIESNDCSFVAADVGKSLPFDDDTFDVGWSVWTLPYVRKPLEALLEVNRVMKPGGLFLWHAPFSGTPFLNLSFKEIKNLSPGMEDYFTVQPKVIVNHPPIEERAPLSSPLVRQYGFRAKRFHPFVKGKAKDWFRVSCYGERVPWIARLPFGTEDDMEGAFFWDSIANIGKRGLKTPASKDLSFKDYVREREIDVDDIPLEPLLRINAPKTPQ